MKCSLCHRELTNTSSAVRGMGSDCAERYARYLAECGSSLEEFGALAMSDDPTARKWAEIARRAIQAGNKNHAKHFLESARRASRMIELPQAA